MSFFTKNKFYRLTTRAGLKSPVTVWLVPNVMVSVENLLSLIFSPTKSQYSVLTQNYCLVAPKLQKTPMPIEFYL